MRITIQKHICIDKMMTGKGCRLYYTWAHAHFFTFWGLRIVIGKPRGDTEQEKLEKLR